MELVDRITIRASSQHLTVTFFRLSARSDLTLSKCLLDIALYGSGRRPHWRWNLWWGIHLKWRLYFKERSITSELSVFFKLIQAAKWEWKSLNESRNHPNSIEAKNGEVKFLPIQEAWLILAQDLIQAIYETIKKELPLILVTTASRNGFG